MAPLFQYLLLLIFGCFLLLMAIPRTASSYQIWLSSLHIPSHLNEWCAWGHNSNPPCCMCVHQRSPHSILTSDDTLVPPFWRLASRPHSSNMTAVRFHYESHIIMEPAMEVQYAPTNVDYEGLATKYSIKVFAAAPLKAPSLSCVLPYDFCIWYGNNLIPTCSRLTGKVLRYFPSPRWRLFVHWRYGEAYWRVPLWIAGNLSLQPFGSRFLNIDIREGTDDTKTHSIWVFITLPLPPKGQFVCPHTTSTSCN